MQHEGNGDRLRGRNLSLDESLELVEAVHRGRLSGIERQFELFGEPSNIDEPGVREMIEEMKEGQRQLRVLAAERAAARDWGAALAKLDRVLRRRALVAWFVRGVLSRDDLREALREAWPDTEFPSDHRGTWLRLFREAGFVADSDERLKGELTIYRGVAENPYGEHDWELGMSWTLDEERAQWFARRLHGYGPRVVRAVVDAEEVLGYFTGRKEQEVVVDPVTLGQVTVEYLYDDEDEGGEDDAS